MPDKDKVVKQEEKELPMTEAPISLTFKLAYKGIEVLATKREEHAVLKPYLEGAKIAIDWALENGFEVPAPRFPKKEIKPIEYVEGRKCPLCGGRLITPPPGTNKPIKCEFSKYNFQTRQTEGCTHVEWPNQTRIPSFPERDINQ